MDSLQHRLPCLHFPLVNFSDRLSCEDKVADAAQKEQESCAFFGIEPCQMCWCARETKHFVPFGTGIV